MKHKHIKIFVPILVIGLAVTGFFILKPSSGELRSISSDTELYSFYTGSSGINPRDNLFLRIITLPFSLLKGRSYYETCPYCYDYDDYLPTDSKRWGDGMNAVPQSESESDASDFSTTNIQVENVDEADIIKNDGNYLYSLSGTEVVITDVHDPANPVVASRIESPDGSAPEDLILSGDVLTIISTERTNNRLNWTYSHRLQGSTIVRVYDIKDRKDPRLEKNYTLNEPYYTSRRIENQLYVIASGPLYAKDSKVVLEYEEDYTTKTFPATSVRYLKDVKTNNLTLISRIDLDNLNSEIELEPFLLDISNAYVSERAFYLLDEKYKYSEERTILDDLGHLFGLKGVFGFFEYEYNLYDDYDYDYNTEIYKFDIKESGDIAYSAKATTKGSTINQYSLDEKDGHLRIALEDNDGSYIAIFNEELNKIGESGHLSKNERMYASRFMGDKAYLVTYRNTDPLFVIDLSDETNPKVLGELKIPGYSVYLHPYDETHLIGIGVDTEETTRRDINGHVISTTAYVTGMKLALFDVTDVKNPKEISKVRIGDSRTTSAILTNPKALLFSKERHILAIPVNNYTDDFKVELSLSDSDTVTEYLDAFRKREDYISEGYLVYNIDLENGISEKGSIVHKDSRLIRGAYIDNNILTVSENTLKINELENLKPISELDLSNKQ